MLSFWSYSSTCSPDSVATQPVTVGPGLFSLLWPVMPCRCSLFSRPVMPCRCSLLRPVMPCGCSLLRPVMLCRCCLDLWCLAGAPCLDLLCLAGAPCLDLWYFAGAPGLVPPQGGAPAQEAAFDRSYRGSACTPGEGGGISVVEGGNGACWVQSKPGNTATSTGDWFRLALFFTFLSVKGTLLGTGCSAFFCVSWNLWLEIQFLFEKTWCCPGDSFSEILRREHWDYLFDPCENCESM